VFVILIALAMVIPASAIGTKTKTPNTTSPNPRTVNRSAIFEDGFETYADWLINFPPWTCIDVDGSPTFGHNQFTWPHQWEPYAFIIFNPDTTTPPQTAPELQPHTGDKEAMAVNDNNAGYISDDWLITPQLSGSYDSVSFWAHSYSSQYNLERFTVCVSTTDTNPTSFTMISTAPYIIAPLAWTEYTFDISSYSGQSIYIGIHYVSVDSWMLFVDDFQVTGITDSTPPVTTCTLDGTMSGGVYITPVTATLTAVDTESGVDYTNYKVDSGAWTNYTAPFIVSDEGAHTITFYSVDKAGNKETDKTSNFTIQFPIQITIKGGLGVKATIKNTGTVNLTNISWSINLNGGIILVGKSKPGTIASLAVGAQTTVKDFVIGFGKTNIVVTADGVTKNATGTVLLFFVIGVA